MKGFYKHTSPDPANPIQGGGKSLFLDGRAIGQHLNHVPPVPESESKYIYEKFLRSCPKAAQIEMIEPKKSHRKGQTRKDKEMTIATPPGIDITHVMGGRRRVRVRLLCFFGRLSLLRRCMLLLLLGGRHPYFSLPFSFALLTAQFTTL